MRWRPGAGPADAAVDWSLDATGGRDGGRRCRSSSPTTTRSRRALAWRARRGRPPGGASRRCRGAAGPGARVGGQRRRHRPAGGRGGARSARPARPIPLLLLVSTRRSVRRRASARCRASRPIRCSPSRPTRRARSARRAAALEAWRRTGLRVVVARPFPPHRPGPGARLRRPGLRRRGSGRPRAPGGRPVPTGNLDPVRDLLDVRDVVAAYRLLLADGAAGRGLQRRPRRRASRWPTLFGRLAALIGRRGDARARPGAGAPSRHPASRGRFD